MAIIESTQAFVYAAVVGGIFICLLAYVYYLWGNKKRGSRIEKRGQIIFDDQPYEIRKKR
ncbi:MAG: CcoQ/FixQ family Cbb3-type cytochrome c oxidase assembly chaperone [SAR324 cluster bacterium]|nr:CcoQ/FixQ family Cbb3-type cytochrome c oxidase assembly chaperone [SAR324 cluster bacterium]